MAAHPAAPKRNLAFPAIGALMLLAGLGFGGLRLAFLLGSEGSSPAAYAVGERVTVHYLPEAPHEARLAGWGSLFGGHLLAIGLGLVFLWVGIKDLRTPPKA